MNEQKDCHLLISPFFCRKIFHLSQFHLSLIKPLIVSSHIVILNDNTLYLQGNCTGSTIRVTTEDPEASCRHGIDMSTTHSYFGDYNGVIGCLSGDGRVLFLERDNVCIQGAEWRERKANVVLKALKSNIEGDEFDDINDTIRFGLMALAGNGHVVAIPSHHCHPRHEVFEDGSEKANGKLTIYEFETLEFFKAYVTAMNVNKRRKGMKRLQISHWRLIGEKDECTSAVQLLATATSFAVLLADGSVYTCGDVRHCSTLGRNVSQEANNSNCKDSDTENIPAHRPGQVTALGGLRVRKIIGKGWYMAALTEDKEAYVWGGIPGNDRLIRDLVMKKKNMVNQDNTGDDHCSEENTEETENSDSDSEDIHLLQIPSVQDILDVGIGCSHLVVLARMENGEEKVMAFGMGENGQLGLGRALDWSSEFLDLVRFDGKDIDTDDGKRVVVSVWCGDYSTLVGTA